MVELLDKFLVEVLSELGMNEYERRAYVAILESGTAVAREISLHANIPYSKVYQILDFLRDEQLIETNDGRPRKFTALNPQISLPRRLDKIQSEWEEGFNNLVRKVNKIQDQLLSLYNMNLSSIPLEEGVWSLQGNEKIIEHMLTLLNRAKKVQFIGTDNSKSDILQKNLSSESTFIHIPSNNSKVLVIFDSFAMISYIPDRNPIAVVNQIKQHVIAELDSLGVEL